MAAKGAADPEHIRARYKLLLSDAKLKWTMDCSDIGGEMLKAGRWGSSAMISALCAAFKTRAHDSLEQALRETSNTIGSRRKAWDKALDALSDAIHSEFADVEAMVIGQSQGSMIKIPAQGLSLANRLVSNTISALIAEVEAYRVGWSSPAPEKFTERHPVLWPLILLLIGTLIGLLADPVKDRIGALLDSPTVIHSAPANSPTRSG